MKKSVNYLIPVILILGGIAFFSKPAQSDDGIVTGDGDVVHPDDCVINPAECVIHPDLPLESVQMDLQQLANSIGHGATQSYFINVFPTSWESCNPISLPKLRIVDNLPAGVTVTPDEQNVYCFGSGSSPTLNYDSTVHRITWDFGNFSGSSCELYIGCLIQVEVADHAGGKLCNQVSVLTDAEEPKANNTARVCADVKESFADVYVTNYAPVSVQPDRHFIYYLSYGNLSSGSDTAGNVKLVDQLPAEFVFVQASLGAAYNSSTHTVTWNLGNLAAGASDYQWIEGYLSASVPLKTVVQDCVTITADNDGIAGNNQSCISSTASTTVDANNKRVCEADDDVNYCLEHDNQSGGPVQPGSELSYVIQAENAGAEVAQAVSVTDVLDLNLDASTLVIGNNGSYDPATRTLHWEVGNLAAGQKTQVGFKVRLRADATCGMSAVNQAIITFPTALNPVTPTNVVANWVPYPEGDVNRDCKVDRADIDLIMQLKNRPDTACLVCDLNHDGVITIHDARLAVVRCTKPLCVP